MKYEYLSDIKIPKIGFGTWRIGGDGHAEPERDALSMKALRSALEMGYTHFDTAEGYAAGHAEELIGQAIRDEHLEREDLFITSKVSPEHLSYSDVLKSCENSLRRLDMDYLDLYLIHWPRAGMKLSDTFKALNLLVSQGKVKYLGVSNFNLKLLKESVSLADTPLITDQVSYSLPDRSYEKNGVLAYCQENNILLTAYSPVKHRFTAGNRNLKSLAEKYGMTTRQLALAWLVRQRRVITIPMSFNPQHQAENLAAAEVVIDDSEWDVFERGM